MFDRYRQEAEARRAKGLPPLPLDEEQASELCRLLEQPPPGSEALLLDLMENRVPPGVDPAARIKAAFLGALAVGKAGSPLIGVEKAVEFLGAMQGGYNIEYLTTFLEDVRLAPLAAVQLKNAVFIGDGYKKVADRMGTNPWAGQVMVSWAEAEWFLNRPGLPEKISGIVFRVDGEITTDDFSPAAEAGTRSDIPLHALSMLRRRVDSPLETIADLKKKGLPVVFAGDVVGTGSSRKSAVNSLVWHIGNDIPGIPNKRRGGLVLGGKIAPIFYNTLEDAGALPVECDVTALETGDIIAVFPRQNRIIIESKKNREVPFYLRSPVLMDEVRAGGRIRLIVGRTLTATARRHLGLVESDVFARPPRPAEKTGGFTLAQKIVGRACGKKGVVPGEYCEPVLATVGSQDTTGTMTRDELKELACLSFGADLVMQSFCHTAAYPTDRDRAMHRNLTAFFVERGGIALKPGDGVIHAWLNRLILPDTVGTGGDSHTRFPVGISFPAGSGLVAFAAAMGKMPLDMPESVLVRLTGKRHNGITLRDVVNMIPLTAIEKGLLTVAKENKKNIFSGRIMEIESDQPLTVPQAFELTNASAERSAAAAAIRLDPEQVREYTCACRNFLEQLLAAGYQDAAAIRRRMAAMDTWLADPDLLAADEDATYAAVVDVDLSALREPVLACPNDPDDVRILSAVAGTGIDEVFIGSCMTGIDHFRQAARILSRVDKLSSRLWVTPPTRMDRDALAAEGALAVFQRLGARIEIPGCSLCMGNQARVSPGTTVMSTSTRNFPHRMGDNTRVFLGSAEIAAVCAILGRIPTVDEYMRFW
ncbi:MAG: bifunctional aconitate hydratase 2/2-methylisocitrate dehydratase [Thermodesulfobacteriota bacterium]